MTEYAARFARAQALMDHAELDAILLTTEHDIRYMTGFLTRFWESPTRPWYLILPRQGWPIAVIPEIGAALMSQTWITDIRTWSAPDYNDDGISLLVEALGQARVGIPSGLETHVRMPLSDFRRLEAAGVQVAGDRGIMARLRSVKSDYEIAKIRAACGVADRAFARVGEIASDGVALSDVFRRFQMLCLEEGADWVGYLAGGAGPGGYTDVISPATDQPLVAGDVLMLDTGVVLNGYYCDFDRNYALGSVNTPYRQLVDAAAAGFEAAKPGATAADLFHTMNRVLGGTARGRLGHGLGLQLTEGLSLIPADHTPLEPGMVLTLEPVIESAPGRIMVHEENIVITKTGASWLSTPAAERLPEI